MLQNLMDMNEGKFLKIIIDFFFKTTICNPTFNTKNIIRYIQCMKSKQQPNLKIRLAQKFQSGEWQSIIFKKMQECGDNVKF
jgi:hypothetical protein